MTPPVQFDTDTASAALRIAIYSELDGRTTELVFSQFPVRIGRNRHNDLVLRHEYVSQWHAAIGFVGGQLNLLQVGSSNSVRVDGLKLMANQLLPITGTEEIRIVPFALRCQMVSAPAPTYRPTVAPVDDLPLPDLPLPGQQPLPGQVPLPGHDPAQEQVPLPGHDPMSGHPTHLPPGQPPAAWDPAAQTQQPPQPPAPPQPLDQMPSHPPMVESPTGSAHVPAAQWDQGQPSGGDAQAEALALMDRLAERYLGRPLSGAQDVAEVGARLEQTLDIFLRYFVAIQKGQVQFYDQMGLPPPGEQLNMIEQCTSSAQLGGQALSPTEPRATMELEEAFESLMQHQSAVLKSIQKGVRSLLRRISPAAMGKIAGRLTRSPDVRTLWETFRQEHEDLSEDQEAFNVVYGGQFRKTYLRLMQRGREAMRGQNR